MEEREHRTLCDPLLFKFLWRTWMETGGIFISKLWLIQTWEGKAILRHSLKTPQGTRPREGWKFQRTGIVGTEGGAEVFEEVCLIGSGWNQSWMVHLSWTSAASELQTSAPANAPHPSGKPLSPAPCYQPACCVSCPQAHGDTACLRTLCGPMEPAWPIG